MVYLPAQVKQLSQRIRRRWRLVVGVSLLWPENLRTPKDFRLEFDVVRFPGAK